MTRLTPTSTLFPYTTLFRSEHEVDPVPLRLRPGHEPVQPAAGRVRAVRHRRAAQHLARPHQPGPQLQRLIDRHVQIGRATSELQSRENLVCRRLLEKKK